MFELGYLLTSLIAGGLTVLAPCTLPLLPVIIGGSTTGKSLAKPVRVISALIISIVVFTLLLRVGSGALGIPDSAWKWITGSILVGFGVVTLFPEIWERLSARLNLGGSSNKLLAKGMQRGGAIGDILIGASLGPIFLSCSPTYGAILGIIAEPDSYVTGLVYLITYSIGLAIPLMLIAIYGQKLTQKLGVLSDPKGLFKRVIAIIFILVGVGIMLGWDKDFEAWLIEKGIYDGIVELEYNLTD
ncbi:MAG: cytochrome c biogenesis protein CcdA [Patescibacteria group bacterium]